MEQVSRYETDRNKNPLSITAAAAPMQPAIRAPQLVPRPDAAPGGGQSCVGKELTVVGTIRGKATLESLFVDGRVEGGIDLPTSRVTVGQNGLVRAGIVACDIVVLGEVLGNLEAAHRIDIRAKASVIGDACAPRVSIEDGAYFKGRMSAGDAQESTAEAAHTPERVCAGPAEMARPVRVPVENRKPRAQSALQTA